MTRDRDRNAPPRARASRRVLCSLVTITNTAILEEGHWRVGEGDGAWQRLLATSVHGLLPQKSRAPTSTERRRGTMGQAGSGGRWN
ncbi:hypothetical protein ACQJBY_048377 [Aegilops geniculata]